MMFEVEEQVSQAIRKTPDLVVVPVGCGSFAQAAVTFWKSRPYPCVVVTVEPNAAACLKTSLENGSPTSISTESTIMDGLNCGTVSTIAWPLLQRGVDASVSISDTEADKAVQDLECWEWM